MQETMVRQAIRFFGSISNMANTIGVSRATIYRYLEGGSIPSEVALRIEFKSGRRISYKKLIPWKAKYHLELDVFPDALIDLLLTKIIISGEVPHFPDQKGLPVPNQRAICVDENNHLIYGLEAIEATRKQRKKSVLAWRISLLNLQNEKYEIYALKRAFDLMERTGIGIALDKRLGERRGRNNVHNSAHLFFGKGTKTRTITSNRLGLGSHFTYEQLKKILQHGDKELIKQVREKKLTPYAAYQCIKNNNLQLPSSQSFHL
ncbi:MAG: hypothetical protein CFE62_006520 [Candidatus Aquirickettsiella gammari]|uniref:Uncharacterized protein n=1 Tax=Candidatus Aquirickettsiella gammari TaxID=2016198 RepID=A0A370CHV0_9COXI|nr:MAG: hypothetical protein CFE62_006520 [Candidatus Aquirickettsiella gammari]